MRVKARECCDLVILSLYVFIPPSRGLEIRTLQIVSDPTSIEAKQQKQRNLLMLGDKTVVLKFNDFKTKASSGRDELSLEVKRLLNILYYPQQRPAAKLLMMTYITNRQGIHNNNTIPTVIMSVTYSLSCLSLFLGRARTLQNSGKLHQGFPAAARK